MSRQVHGYAQQATLTDSASGADVNDIGDATNKAVRANVVTGSVGPATLSLTGTGTNVNDTPVAATDVGAYRSVSVALTGSFNQGITFEQSNDNANWFNLHLLRLDAAAGQGDPQGPTNNIVTGSALWGGALSARYFRARVSSASSGTCTATAWFSSNPFTPAFVQAAISTIGGSAVASLGTSSSDGIAVSNNAVGVNAFNLLSNGAASNSADRQRNNTDATLLASGARTGTTATPDQVNYNGRGVRVVLDVTVASGTGGLQVVIQGKDSISGNYYALNATPTAVVATGTKVYDLYPGIGAAAAGITQTTSQVLPRSWRVNVVHGDGTSYTYSVSAVTIL